MCVYNVQLPLTWPGLLISRQDWLVPCPCCLLAFLPSKHQHKAAIGIAYRLCAGPASLWGGAQLLASRLPLTVCYRYHAFTQRVRIQTPNYTIQGRGTRHNPLARAIQRTNPIAVAWGYSVLAWDTNFPEQPSQQPPNRSSVCTNELAYCPKASALTIKLLG